MKNKREYLLALSFSLLGLQANNAFEQDALAQAPPKKGEKAVNCFGINKKAGDNGCAVSKAQADAANSLYKNKFTKAKEFDCAGNIDGSAAEGYLGWVSEKSEGDCIKASGFIFKADSNKRKVTIKDKTGNHVLEKDKAEKFVEKK